MIKRLISGSILLPLSITAVLYSNESLLILTILISGGLIFELSRVFYPNNYHLIWPIGTPLIAYVLYTCQHPLAFQITQHPLCMILCLTFLSLCIYETRQKKLLFKNWHLFNATRILGILLLFGPFALLLNTFQNGKSLIVLFGLIIAMSDIGAYFIGKKWGKRPLSPLSPKKTIEGSIGGLIGAILTGLIGASILNLPIINALTWSIIINIFAQFGDLYESLIKREYKIKDISNLIPGHGGIYDRCDSYIFVFPAMYYILLL